MITTTSPLNKQCMNFLISYTFFKKVQCKERGAMCTNGYMSDDAMGFFQKGLRREEHDGL
jgi:hypothetical protein